LDLNRFAPVDLRLRALGGVQAQQVVHLVAPGRRLFQRMGA